MSAETRRMAEARRLLGQHGYRHDAALLAALERAEKAEAEVNALAERVGWEDHLLERAEKAEEATRYQKSLYLQAEGFQIEAEQRAEKAEAEVQDLKARAILDLSALQEAGEEVERLKDELRRVKAASLYADGHMRVIIDMDRRYDHLKAHADQTERELDKAHAQVGEYGAIKAHLTASQREVERLKTTISRVEALADSWARDGLAACLGSDHGGGCADCIGTVYAAELCTALETP